MLQLPLRKAIAVFCIVGTMAIIAQAQKPAAKISAYADSQCKSKDGDAATQCRLEALWAAAHCDPAVLQPQAKLQEVGQPVCLVSAGRFAFDVVSIKPHVYVAGERASSATVGVLLDGYRSLNAPISYLILNAYNVGSQSDITGGPKWLTDDRYDFEAKYVQEVADAMQKLDRDDYSFVLRSLLQQLLKDRMKFAAHIEKKDVPAYDLVVGKNGPKLKEADLNAKDTGETVARADPDRPGMMLMVARGMRMSDLARRIAALAGRPVFDQTGLTGLYDITLEYPRQQTLLATTPRARAPSVGPIGVPDPSAGAPTIEDGISTLGLKLVPARGPISVLTIEHIEKPEVN